MNNVNKRRENVLLYVAIIASAIVLGWVFVSSFQISRLNETGNPISQDFGEVDNDCGDITDASNIQHLSHHPDLFAECIKKIDPSLFKQATGEEKSTYMADNGLI